MNALPELVSNVAGGAKKLPSDIDQTLELLSRGGYVADRALATVLFLALKMGRPLFLEGEAGVGKTEIAKVLATTLGRPLIRLQCYEGLDISSAVYEWNYAAQMVEIRVHEAAGDREKAADRKGCVLRPLPDPPAAAAGARKPRRRRAGAADRRARPHRRGIRGVPARNPVRLPGDDSRIRDGARPTTPPIVIITTNRTREIHDALKRRCLYHWVDYPDAERELAILKVKAPRAGEQLSREIVAYVQKLRKMDLFKNPGVAETIDWASALIELDKMALDPATVADTPACCSNTRTTLPASYRATARRCSTKSRRRCAPHRDGRTHARSDRR